MLRPCNCVNVGDADVQPAHDMSGIGGRELNTWVGRFEAVGIGNEVIGNARLRFADLFGADRENSPGSHLQAVGAAATP